ncbi:MAG: c-type cytochrome biogenesis protein CcmI [Asticcacaulis sp.]|uniref:c-type cytochrome biogenesis protein CcmI n=1 Tax=Asticcacaulis sp. TaxID=1872648 RepID=UPI0039E6A885
MLLFFLTCVLICAALIALAVAWQRLRRETAGLVQEKALYAGFVADVERRVAKGEIDESQGEEERTQAARALLKASEAGEATAALKPLHGYIALGAVAVLSVAVYLTVGHPDQPDQPYKRRLQTWTRLAQTNPDVLPPQAMAAVLRQGQKGHANDVTYWLFLGRIDMLAGNNYDGAKDYEKARALAPETFTAWSELGEALTFVGGGTSGAEAMQAFEKALQLNPNDARAHYYLGQQALADGQYAAARSHYTAALNSMAPDYVNRPQVQAALASIGPAEAAAKAMSDRISGMVTSLEAQLKADPENADGWARLLRSYDVLGDKRRRAEAQAAMTKHYAGRPEVIADILAKSQTRVGSEGESK